MLAYLGNRHRHAPDRLRRQLRQILVSGFTAFGKAQSSAGRSRPVRQPGGQRAGRKVVFEKSDLDMVKETANFVRHACLETVRRPGIAYATGWSEPLPSAASARIRRDAHEEASEGRWINPSMNLSAAVSVFLGARVREQLFGVASPQWARPS